MQAGPRRITPYSPFAPCRGERRNYLASTKYPTSVPSRTQISPGVWSDGNDRVFSSAYPAVQQFLDQARTTLKQPVPPNDIVFTLAALDVFYKPGDPAHWVFWSDEKKHQTAEVVSRIALHQPPLIRTPVAWNGSSEYLYILANHHGSSHRHAYESQPWYAKLVPQKASSAPKVLNLRKRKTNPGAFREPSKSPGPEDDEPVEDQPRKKFKSRLASTPEPPSNVVQALSDNAESSSVNQTKKSNSTSTSEVNSHENPSKKSGLPDEDISPTEDVAQSRMSTRNRKVVHSQTSTNSSRASSASPADLPLSSNSHSRDRSISYASSQTVVATGSGRRSASVLSASTAVDGRGSVKDKQPAADNDQLDRKEASDTDDEGMVTRGRASRARVDSSKITTDTDSEKLKIGKLSTATRTGIQKAKRKP